MLNPCSQKDCGQLVDAILNTLRNKPGFNMSDIKHYPKPFVRNDGDIFDGLSAAILSTQTDWDPMEKHLGTIKNYLCGYKLPLLSSQSVNQIEHIYDNYIQPLNIRARFLKRECLDIWKNSIIFQKIQRDHGSVWEFINSCLDRKAYDIAHNCYVQPDTQVIDSFLVDTYGQYKLWGVGYTIVREFYNNIGIDDFKPDGNIVRVFGSIGVQGFIAKNPSAIRQKGQVGKQNPKKMRQIGIILATTAKSPRKYMDSLLWHFGREICKQSMPGCSICDLKKSGIC